MNNRVKIAEPVWSSQTAKQNETAKTAKQGELKARARKRYRVTNDMHEPSDCYNCTKALNGQCTVVKARQPRPPLEYCQKVYTNCQFWERIH